MIDSGSLYDCHSLNNENITNMVFQLNVVTKKSKLRRRPFPAFVTKARNQNGGVFLPYQVYKTMNTVTIGLVENTY